MFEDRADAGRQLAQHLRRYANRADVSVLALPRGGLPVAAEVARALRAPLDVFLVRKLGVPGHEELAMGAIASGGVRVVNTDVIDQLEIAPRIVDLVTMNEQRALEHLERLYRGGRAPLDVRGRVAIVVDDGLATGSSMRAAAAALRVQQPARLVLAAPVAATGTRGELRHHADEVVIVMTPEPFHAVGLWYLDFRQVTVEECSDLLADHYAGVAPLL
jgi:putative phosphoribosyl transferase